MRSYKCETKNLEFTDPSYIGVFKSEGSTGRSFMQVYYMKISVGITNV